MSAFPDGMQHTEAMPMHCILCLTGEPKIRIKIVWLLIYYTWMQTWLDKVIRVFIFFFEFLTDKTDIG